MGLGARLRSYVGMVPNPISPKTREARSRLRGAAVTVSVCPYCAVGCSQLIYTKARPPSACCTARSA